MVLARCQSSNVTVNDPTVKSLLITRLSNKIINVNCIIHYQ